MKVRHIKNSWVPKLLKVDAIVLYPFVLYAYQYPSARLIRHEMIHVKQIRKLGVFGFYFRYFLEYSKYRIKGYDHYNAYMNISFEKEAYELEDII